MLKQKQWKIKLISILFMISGSILIFAIVIAINRSGKEHDKNLMKNIIEFEVKKTKQKKQQKKIQPAEKNQRKTQKSLAPLPDIAPNITGIEINIPEYEADEFLNIDTSALGEVAGLNMSSDSELTKPQLIKYQQPKYPNRALVQNKSGKVVLSLFIDKAGLVQKIKVLQSDPPELFDQAAVNAVRQWQFKPAMLKGEKAEIWVTLPVVFELQ